MTQEWWDTKNQDSELYTSEFVLDELEAGDPEVSRQRLGAVEHLPLLAISDEIVSLGLAIADRTFFPEKAKTDAFHLACATVHEMDVLLTWNCKHLANPVILVELNKYLVLQGYVPPLVYTPEEMIGEV
ncbi:MAG: type II toxin-antitoxin system VapC family toxin [Planctomycetota bacterium]